MSNGSTDLPAVETSETFGLLPVVVLISGGGSNLQALIDSPDHHRLYKIVHVVSNRPGVKGLERAESANIAWSVVNHKEYGERAEFDTAIAEKIDEAFASFRAEQEHRSVPAANHGLVVLAGFMRILSANFTERFQGRLVNIHPSLLPNHAGLNTHQRAIDAKDSKAGVTIHFVTADLDGGPPIVQAQVPIDAEDTADHLASKVLVQEHIIYPIVVKWFAQGRLAMRDGLSFLDGERLPLTGLILDPLAES